ncbi:hypothetical protein [Candidatus Thiodictyon syntrophicum]|jgi:hypothetical protein|uniref:Uncharacterized protein n=1 Tax=Candidatus Thiodictyon syntrophicum TaxID=1166950 RepID=A0A2K8U3S1_9GAMM|nr:hypothetical protein [Candidatus Thiodictyon syntrophicum]AUB80059.1 hypothetical protein THSYN_03155 [Candidatus Thiodictyon syntrophicum]
MKNLSIGVVFATFLTAGCQGELRETQGPTDTAPPGKRVRVTAQAIEDAHAKSAQDTPYAGDSRCGKMNLTINFTLDARREVVRDFIAAHYCGVDELSGGLIWKAPKEILVSREGKFSYHDANGNEVKGSIAGSGAAAGEVNAPPIMITCRDGQAYRGCTRWSAAPTPR